MSTTESAAKAGRDDKGHFTKGQRGPGRPKGTLNKATQERVKREQSVLARAREYFDSARYWKNIEARIARGRAMPIELYYLQKCFGKPVELMKFEGTGGSPLQVVQTSLPDKQPLPQVIDAEVVTETRPAGATAVLALPDNGTGSQNGHGPNGHG